MDSTVQAASGFISVTGLPEGRGIRTPATFIDMGTGIQLASAIRAALIQRAQTGRGQKVEVSMLDISIPSMTGLIANELEGKSYKRMGNRHRNACPSNVYAASDGDIMIFCLTETHWRSVARLMGREDLIESPSYKDHASRFAIADEVDGLVSEWTRKHRRDELVDLLLEHGVPCAPVQPIPELAADPEMQRRQMLIDSEFPTRGPIKVIGSPLKFSDAAAVARSRPRPPPCPDHYGQV